MVAEEQKQLAPAVDYYFQALEIYAAYPGDHNQTIAMGSLSRVWQAAGAAPAFDKAAVPQRLAGILGIPPAEAAARLSQ